MFLDVPIFSHRHVLEFIVGTLPSIAMDNTLKRINLNEMYSRFLHNFMTPVKLSKSKFINEATFISRLRWGPQRKLFEMVYNVISKNTSGKQ